MFRLFEGAFPEVSPDNLHIGVVGQSNVVSYLHIPLRGGRLSRPPQGHAHIPREPSLFRDVTQDRLNQILVVISHQAVL